MSGDLTTSELLCIGYRLRWLGWVWVCTLRRWAPACLGLRATQPSPTALTPGPPTVCRPSGVGRSRRANAGSRLASLLRHEGGKAAYQEPESESEGGQEWDAWAQRGSGSWGGYGAPAGAGGGSASEGERLSGGQWYGEAAARQEEAAEEGEEHEEEEQEGEDGQFGDPMDAEYGLADVALERVRVLRMLCMLRPSCCAACAGCCLGHWLGFVF